VVNLATRLPSFNAARDSVAETLEVELTTKRVERLAKRIGMDRCAERDAAVIDWENRPLVEKLTAPAGVKAPEVVCVSCDAGRAQRCDLPESAKTNWCATNVGSLQELKPNPQASDPCPQVPDKFLTLGQVDELTREIKGSTPKGTTFQRTPSEESPVAQATPAAPQKIVAPSPEITSRDVVATFAPCPAFGKILAARAWLLGFAAATLKAFVADGQSSNWTIWEQHFKHLEFVPILDFIHALTYVYSAAMAGQSPEDGWATYVRWITWVWQGQVPRVIDELASRSEQLGPAPADVPDSDPRALVATTLTYLRNQQSRMNYPEYRRLGLPITSSPMESAVKQINYRVKGCEKFWAREGGEGMLELRAEKLSDTAPLEVYWACRAAHATGTRQYRAAA